MVNNQSPLVVILGAGLAGLACGYELTKSGRRVIIIEKETEVGGLAKTIKVNEFSFDTGPHRWYTKNDMVNNWMLKLMNKEIIQVPRLTRIYFDKKFFNYPVQIKSTLIGMGLLKTTVAVIDYLYVRIKSIFIKTVPISLEDGYISKFGNTLYKMFFKRYSEKLWGVSCKKISADWIGQRSRGFNVSTVIKNAIIPKEKIVSFVDEFSYPKLGIGRIAEKLAKEITFGGGEILLNSSVKSIIHDQNKISSILIKNNQMSKTIIADEIVSTIPMSELIQCLNPPAEKQILKINKALTYRDELQVVLFINKTHITPDTWVYVHPFEIPFVRFMEMDNWSLDLSPQGKTAIVFEVVCNQGDKTWKKTDAELIKWISEKFINEFKLITQKNIIGSYVHRITGEYPVYHIGYQKDIEFLKNYLKQFKNLQIAGRNGTFRYNNMDHSIEMGLYAAWNIIENERKFDIENVNIEREYLEEKRVNTKDMELAEDEHVESVKN